MKDKTGPQPPPQGGLPRERAEWEQQIIGWDNLLFGRLSSSWVEAQEHHYKALQLWKSAEWWIANFMYHLLQISYALWELRNHILHERDCNGLEIPAGKTLTLMVTTLYNRGWRSLLHKDQYLIHDTSLEELLWHPATAKEDWIAEVCIAFRAAHNTTGNENAWMRTDLHSFLQTGFCRQSTSDEVEDPLDATDGVPLQLD